MRLISKKRSKYLEYISLRLIEEFLSIIPRPIALKVGESVGAILYLTGLYRHIALRNMEHIGLWDKQHIETNLRGLYRNIGRYATDFLRRTKKLPPYQIINFELVETAMSEGKGLIVLLAHYGNWELLAEVFGRAVKDLNVIAKPMKNELVDKWLGKKRSRSAVKTIYTKEALRKMLEVIKRNGIIAILIDQHAGRHGTMVPFLGKDANTVRTVAGIARKTDCSVLAISAIMDDKDNSYKIILEKPAKPDLHDKSEEECIAEYQRIHNEVISEWIRKDPQHWFGWFHKRFRGTISYS